MKNKLLFFLINFALIYVFIFLFIYSKEVKYTVLNSISIWLNNLVPSIFPFLIITNLLNNYGLIELISKIIGPTVEKIYKLPKEASIVIVESLFTGFPTGSKYTKDLLDNKIITKEGANHLITFTSYSSPIFVISVVGEGLLKSRKIGIYIFICHIITGLITGLLFKRNNNIKNIKTKTNHKSFTEVFLKSINSSLKILVNMLGIMIFFSIIITTIIIIFPNNIFTTIIKGILEITTGIIIISKEKYNLKFKAALIGSLLSFNGLSVHYQTKSIIENSEIQYKQFLFARIIHSLLCFIFIYFL